VASVDAHKLAAVPLLADARLGLEALTEALQGYRADDDYVRGYTEHKQRWNQVVDEAYHLDHQPLPAQTAVLGALNEAIGPDAVVVQAAGSMPGDLQMLWRAQDVKQYHVEYAFSCMGYEVAGGLGVKMAAPEREVWVLVGDGSYLMMAQEIVTAVSENIKLNLVIVQNHGFCSIGSLSESLGSQRFGTYYRYRNEESGLLNGDKLPIDLAANAESLGADVIRVKTIDEFREAIERVKSASKTTAIHIETDPLAPVPSSESWWDVPVSQVSELDSTQNAYKAYEEHKSRQRPYLAPSEGSE
jgi:3D-(3,5/4)-trihydroxycyclohexane-1,2-dione acylhydrolase (decyclizing)